MTSQAATIVLDEGTDHEVTLTACDQCRTMWEERNARGVAGSPDCETCRVELLEDNYIPAEIYQLIRGQIKLYFTGESNHELDLDHNALWSMIDHHPKVKNHWEVFIRVYHTYQFFLKERQKK